MPHILYHAKKRENERFVYKFTCVKIYSVLAEMNKGQKWQIPIEETKCHFCLRSHKIKKEEGEEENLIWHPSPFGSLGGGDSF